MIRRAGGWVVVLPWVFAGGWFAFWHVFITWPVWGDPMGRLPGPTGDNCMMAWNLGWVCHALDNGGLGFWCSAAYFPEGNLFIYGSHTWLDGVLLWLFSWGLPGGPEGVLLWANLTLLGATVATGLLTMWGLVAWGVRSWPLLLVLGSGVAFCWFRMFALMGHYNFFGTQYMLLALGLLSWSRAWMMAGRGGEVGLERGAEWERGVGSERGAWIGRGAGWLAVAGGCALGLAALNDQTMAIFGAVLGGLIIGSMAFRGRSGEVRGVLAAGLRYYGAAFVVALVHLVPIVRAALEGRLHYHVDKSLPRLVEATSFFVPNDFHLVGRYLKPLREEIGLGWSEGTYLGVVPGVLFCFVTVVAIGHVFRRSEGTRVCFFAAVAAWVFFVVGLGDRLMVAGEQYFVLPGRVLKEIPLLNNMRVPQRWVWPLHLCLVVGAGTAISGWLRAAGWRRRVEWAVMLPLALIPPLEGRSYPRPDPVDFRSEDMRPVGLIENVRGSYAGGGVLTMPVEVTYAQANVLQFLWGYDIPMSVVYTARMPFSVHELPWHWGAWGPGAGEWLRGKDVRVVVFPFHRDVEEFSGWIEEARRAVPGLVVFNRDGERV